MDEEYQQQKERVRQAIRQKLLLNFGKNFSNASERELYKAIAHAVRDEMMDKWVKTQDMVNSGRYKTVYYLSIEFLTGKFLGSNLINLKRWNVYSDVCKELGINIDDIEGYENEPGLGNGGLGRLAACFLDSLTTADMPAYGCGIRYEYGLFNQRFVKGYQIESADNWLTNGNIWEVKKPDEQVEIKFGGNITENWTDGQLEIKHENYDTIIAVPYDIPVAGYNSNIVNTLRLWSAKSKDAIDMEWFSRGNYLRSYQKKLTGEVISKVLYPEDNNPDGKMLRLKQQYFFVSATIQNIISRFKGKYSLPELPDKVVIHINDTHPTLAIPELMRILMDQEKMGWDEAWDITVRTCAYTNHTVMEEALERWPVSMFKELLPRIYMIVREINDRHCHRLRKLYPNDWQKIDQMAIISYDQIKMANLCLVGCFSINGVSELHTEILKHQVFNNFYALYPEKFHNVTNGITYRRWLLHANPGLSHLFNDAIGDGWNDDSGELKNLETLAENSVFRNEFAKVKKQNKIRLSNYIKECTGILVDADSIFDVQIKRIHEYKRQLLDALHILYLYNRLLDNPNEDIYPRTFIFSGKAAPGYHKAKLIIKLINTIGQKINDDPRLKDRIKVVFLENYNVSLAERIIPAAEVSEQISTAGMEASGTGNMKLMLNGAVTLGTLDGANVEIRAAVGDDNIYIFGLKAHEVENYHRYGGYNPKSIYLGDPYIKKIVDQLINGFLSPENNILFRSIYNYLLYEEHGIADRYMVLKDFDGYKKAHMQIDRDYRMPDIWWKKAIINAANAGRFSSDESIRKYSDDIWHLPKISV